MDDDEGGSGQTGFVAQVGYAIKYMIPVLLLFGAVVAGMYLGGLGYAEIKTTVVQAPLYETTALETNSAEPFYSYKFYCDSTKLNLPLTIIPKDVNSSTSYLVAAEANSATGYYGCATPVAGDGVYKRVIHD